MIAQAVAPYETILEEFFFEHLDEGKAPEETPLMRDYRQKIDLIDEYGLADRWELPRRDLREMLMDAVMEVLL